MKSKHLSECILYMKMELSKPGQTKSGRIYSVNGVLLPEEAFSLNSKMLAFSLKCCFSKTRPCRLYIIPGVNSVPLI